jgi:hypothetical protein
MPVLLKILPEAIVGQGRGLKVGVETCFSIRHRNWQVS